METPPTEAPAVKKNAINGKKRRPIYSRKRTAENQGKVSLQREAI